MRKVTRTREWHDHVQELADDYLKYSQQARVSHEKIIELLRPVGRATSRNKIEKTANRQPSDPGPVPGMFLEITFTGIVPNYSEHRIEFSFCEASHENPDSWSLSNSTDIANEEIGDQCLKFKFEHDTAAHKANEARKRAEEIFNRLFQEKTT